MFVVTASRVSGACPRTSSNNGPPVNRVLMSVSQQKSRFRRAGTKSGGTSAGRAASANHRAERRQPRIFFPGCDECRNSPPVRRAVLDGGFRYDGGDPAAFGGAGHDDYFRGVSQLPGHCRGPVQLGLRRFRAGVLEILGLTGSGSSQAARCESYGSANFSSSVVRSGSAVVCAEPCGRLLHVPAIDPRHHLRSGAAAFRRVHGEWLEHDLHLPSSGRDEGHGLRMTKANDTARRDRQTGQAALEFTLTCGLAIFLVICAVDQMMLMYSYVLTATPRKKACGTRWYTDQEIRRCAPIPARER